MGTIIKDPLVSVIMPVYNGEKYVRESINSILTQTYENFEFIILNDGSTDDSIKIIQELKAKDRRIVLISRENRGLIASLNECIQVAKGEYLVRMDADDISMPNRVDDQLNFMARNPDVSVLGSYVEIFGDQVPNSIWKLPSNDGALKVRLLFTVAFCHPSVMYKRTIFSEDGFAYNNDYVNAEDYELWTKLAEKYKFAVVPKVLLKYRHVSTSISRIADSRNVSNRKRMLASIYRPYLSKLEINNSPDEEQLHFNLTTSERIGGSKQNLTDVITYLTKILEQNKKNKVFCQDSLGRFLGRKLITVFFYQIKQGNLSVVSGVLHKLFFKAVVDVLKKTIV